MKRKLCVLVGLLALVGACAEDEKEAAVGVADFCSGWAIGACSQATVDACQAASVDACRAEQQDVCLDLVGNDFIDNEWEPCLNGIELAYADADLTADELKLIALGGACSKVVSGSADEGEDCAEDRDCDRALDLECVHRGGAALGTCQIPEEIEAGRQCNDPEDVCESGFFCSMDYCLARYDDEEECTYTGQCNREAFCNEDGLCQARFPVNDPCTADEQCDSGVCYEFASGEQVCINRLRLSRSEAICATLR